MHEKSDIIRVQASQYQVVASSDADVYARCFVQVVSDLDGYCYNHQLKWQII